MDRSKILSILASNAKAATVAGIAVVATAGGGAAVVATTVADSSSTNAHATAGKAQAALHKADALAKASAEPSESESSEAADDVTTEATAEATETGRPTDTHGYCVSQAVQQAAHATPAASSSPNQHGKDVSAAAHSCPKPTDVTTSASTESKPVKPTHTAQGQSSTHRQNTAKTHGKASPNAHATSHH